MNKGQVSLLILVWFCFWMGHAAENWTKPALIFTLVYAALSLIGDIKGKQEKKEPIKKEQ